VDDERQNLGFSDGVCFRLDCVGNVDATKFTDAILAELKRQPLLQTTTPYEQREVFGEELFAAK